MLNLERPWVLWSDAKPIELGGGQEKINQQNVNTD